jgi:hypothetical protein
MSSEIALSCRTWFGTLTLSPEQHYLASIRAGSTEFARRHKEISVDLTKYLKRLRWDSGAAFRYCLVVEAHKSGLPHYHMLLHETDPGSAVRYRTLKGQWQHGFSAWKAVDPEEVDPRMAWYAAKYLSKSSLARVRASKDYGSPIRGMEIRSTA